MDELLGLDGAGGFYIWLNQWEANGPDYKMFFVQNVRNNLKNGVYSKQMRLMAAIFLEYKEATENV